MSQPATAAMLSSSRCTLAANLLTDFLDKLRQALGAHPPRRRYLIGISGGRDSMALLAGLHSLGYHKLVIAIGRLLRRPRFDWHAPLTLGNWTFGSMPQRKSSRSRRLPETCATSSFGPAPKGIAAREFFSPTMRTTKSRPVYSISSGERAPLGWRA